MVCTGKRRGSIVSGISKVSKEPDPGLWSLQEFGIDPSQNSKGHLNRGDII